MCAVVGVLLALNGPAGLTIGTQAAFMNPNKSFTRPVTQISRQVSRVVMAEAGTDVYSALWTKSWKQIMDMWCFVAY